tara:strand:+ start:30228 stop:30869 length:642 start_codon:yes stop_codon:yes gene_type:complete
MILFISLLGALMNKIRGGLLTVLYADWLQKNRGLDFQTATLKAEPIFKNSGKHLSHVVFAIVFTSAINPHQYSLLCFVLLYSGMLGGSSFGWGGYLTSMIDRKIDHERDDVSLLDKWFRGDNLPVLSGWAAMSLRGLMWTFCIYYSLFIFNWVVEAPRPSIYIIPLGLTMGSIYLVSMEICQRIKGMVRGNGWQLGEYIWGAYLWGSLWIIIK